MSWAAVASMGLSLLGGSASRSAARIQAQLDQARADADNIVREGKNVESAAKASFAGFMASLNNNRALDAAARAEAAGKTNAGRLADALTRGSIEEQLANAEQAGAYSASLAMNGVGGASSTAIARSLQLKQQRQAFMNKERGQLMQYDQLLQVAGIMPQAIASQDIGTYSASPDYSTTFAPIQQAQGNWLMDLAKGAMSNGGETGRQAVNTASSFFTSKPTVWQLMGDASGVQR